MKEGPTEDTPKVPSVLFVRIGEHGYLIKRSSSRNIKGSVFKSMMKSVCDEECVYRSNLVNGKLFDMMTVNHAKKMVYWFQVTGKTPCELPISVSALHKVFKG